MKRSFKIINGKLVETTTQGNPNRYHVEFDDYHKGQLAAKDARQLTDKLSGLSRSKGAQRGDYKLCRTLDKTLSDFNKFKNPTDRKKIEKEYYGIQKEGR